MSTKELREDAAKLVALLDAPEAGLLTWHQAVGAQIDRIAKYAAPPQADAEARLALRAIDRRVIRKAIAHLLAGEHDLSEKEHAAAEALLAAKDAPMKVAVFDSPRSMAREAWQDGVLIAHIQAAVLQGRDFKGGYWFPFYLNVGPWKEGRVIGDPAAIAAKDAL